MPREEIYIDDLTRPEMLYYLDLVGVQIAPREEPCYTNQGLKIILEVNLKKLGLVLQDLFIDNLI